MERKKNVNGEILVSNILRVHLIEVLEEESKFQKRKEEVQSIISKMIILSSTRGRPRKNDHWEFDNAA